MERVLFGYTFATFSVIFYIFLEYYFNKKPKEKDWF